MRAILVASFVLAAASAGAAEPQNWEAAPVPRVGGREAVSPSVRAGGADGAAQAAPFSGLPVGSVSQGGATSANTTSGVQAPKVSPE